MLSGFVLPVLKYCSAVWCWAADTQIKLLYRVVSGASFLTDGVFVCDIAHRRSVAVLCMPCKIRCNPMHPLYDSLHGPYVPVRITRAALVAHRFTYSTPRRTAGLNPLSVSLWNDLVDQVFYGVRLECFKSRAMILYWPKFILKSLLPFLPFSSFLSIGWYCMAGVFGLIGCISLSHSLALPTTFW